MQLFDTPSDPQKAWLAGYRAARARIIAGIQNDQGGPEHETFRQLSQDYRDAVSSEAQEAANAMKNSATTMQVLLNDAVAQLAAAEAEVVRLTEISGG